MSELASTYGDYHQDNLHSADRKFILYSYDRKPAVSAGTLIYSSEAWSCQRKAESYFHLMTLTEGILGILNIYIRYKYKGYFSCPPQ